VTVVFVGTASIPLEGAHPLTRVADVISCVYCGGAHARPGDVRDCAARHDWVAADGDDGPALGAPAAAVAPSPAARPAPALHELGPASVFWVDGLAALVGGDPPAEPLAVPADNACTADLAPDQLAAVTHPGGSARVLAPAGSGKTRVLTERARHLARRWNVPTAAVTVVAYNKRAQEEIVHRTADLPGLQVRTLNSLALAIISGRSPFAAQPGTWSTDEGVARSVLAQLVSAKAQLNVDPYAPWIDALSVARLGLVEPGEVEARFGGDVPGFADVFPRFRSELARRRTIDFDEQIVRAVELLVTDDAARQAAQRACRVLLVDEFQDLTPAHVLLVRLLAGNGGAVFAVGDDDQTIYGYNGADPRWLIDFAEYFPGAGDHPLEVNYRCPDGVVTAAERLLRHNRRRVPKTIRSAAGARPGGWAAVSGGDPVELSVHAVQAALANGADPADVAVLTRVNSSLVPVQVALGAAGIAVAGGVGPEFLTRTAVRAACAWLQLVTGDAFRGTDLSEAAKRPSRGFSARLREWVAEQRSAEALLRLGGRLNNPKDAERVAGFVADIERLRTLARRGATTAQLLGELFEAVGLSGAVAKLDHNRAGQNLAAQGDDLQAVRQLAAQFPEPAAFEAGVRAALDRPRSSGGVTLATVHRVKGQEWPHVVVHLADADQFPHRLADDREEERRLFHVAITRAREHVAIVSGEHPSVFVGELTTEPPAVLPREPLPARGNDLTAQLARSRPADDLAGAAREQFERLRQWRREVANGKPPYTVFDDKTLVAIVHSEATTLTGLARVKGVGPAKLERYGTAVLAILAGAGPDTAHSAGA
jgi:DNA helicase-2/ATP-dependent DNA helicase PcrA